MKVFRSVFVVAITASMGLAADPMLPDYLPAGTRVLFGVSMSTLLDSPTVKSFREDVEKLSSDLMKSGPMPGLEVARVGQLGGFNPLKDVDDVMVASTAEGAHPSTLIVMHGRFDAKRMPGTPTPRNGTPVFASDLKSAIALLDETTAIMGELPEVNAAIDRWGKGTMIRRGLIQKMATMAGKYDVWGAGELPKGYQAPGGTPDAFNSIDRFEFGLSLKDGLEVVAEVHTRTPKDGETIAESMKMVEALVKAQSKDSASKVDLSFENSTLKIAMTIPEEELKKGIMSQRMLMTAAPKTAQVAAAPIARPRPTPTPLNPKGEVVKNSRGDTVRVTLPGGR